jgi:hypothetical protein
MTRYPSKIGLELVIPLALLLGTTSVIMWLDGAWPGVLINLAVAGFIGLLFWSTHYTIDGHQLRVQAGFFLKEDIDIRSIRRISETRNPISAPAASLDRLDIRYGDRGMVLISPRDKAAFIAHILKIQPDVELKYRK